MANIDQQSTIGGEAEVAENLSAKPVLEAPAPESKVEQNGEAIKYFYHPAKNMRQQRFAGVPWRNLTVAEVEQYPAWLQQALTGAEFYSTEAPEQEGHVNA